MASLRIETHCLGVMAFGFRTHRSRRGRATSPMRATPRLSLLRSRWALAWRQGQRGRERRGPKHCEPQLLRGQAANILPNVRRFLFFPLHPFTIDPQVGLSVLVDHPLCPLAAVG